MLRYIIVLSDDIPSTEDMNGFTLDSNEEFDNIVD
jgi:hypothetical protein